MSPIPGLLLALLAPAVPPAPAEEPFLDLDLPTGLERAAEEGKVVLIDFFTTLCAPCRRMDRTTWADGDVRAWLAERTVPLKVDADEDAELAERFGVRSYPTILLVAPGGEEMDRIVGYRSAEDFVREAEEVLEGRSAIDRLREEIASSKWPALVGARYDLGRELARSGRDEEALEQFLWIYDEGLDRRPSYARVHKSFLLSDISDLGEIGREALRERRDALEGRVLRLEGGELGHWSLARDLASLNRELGDDAETLRIFDALGEPRGERTEDRRRRNARRILALEIVPLLVQRGRHADVIETMDPSAVLRLRARAVLAGAAFLDEGEPDLHELVLRRPTEEAGWLLEAAAGAGAEAEAAEILDVVAESEPTRETYATLLGHARAAPGAQWAVELVLARAADVLGAEEAAALRAPERGGDERRLAARGDERPWVERLEGGSVSAAVDALAARVASGEADATDRFGLGLARVLAAVESLGQGLQRHGMQASRFGFLGFPLTRLPLPDRADPQPVSADDVRSILERFLADLDSASRALAEVGEGDVRLPLRVGRIRLDLGGDGSSLGDTPLWRIFQELNRDFRMQLVDAGADVEELAREFTIVFDSADASWLEGYAHLLMSLVEAALAHDWERPFEHTAHLFFPRPETPYEFLAEEGGTWDEVLDAIALVHLLDLPVREPERMGSALGHLEEMIRLSRVTFDRIEAEDDDEREWIPSPRQTGVVPGIEITADMVAAWRDFLDEAEDLLAGERLVPFWRSAGGRGVNLRRLFTEPRRFDLVLWIQGAAAAPYLEEGELTSGETWARFQRVFQGEFLGFALWFN